MKSKVEDDDLETLTIIEQRKVELLVDHCIRCFELQNSELPGCPALLRDSHTLYLLTSLVNLPRSYQGLDASGPWIIFWTLHSLEVLRTEVPNDLVDKLISYLESCQSKSGGFAGGPDQMPHLATTYAAVMALCILKTRRAYGIIKRSGLCNFLKCCSQPDGSFVVHEGGETDIRGVYCALAVARLLNLPLDLIFGSNFRSVCNSWLSKCQTYEGGFGASPGCEAHGGYTFCGLAAAMLLNSDEQASTSQNRLPFNLDRLLRWVSYRQMRFEGGFQGRTNKLVDACYSYWQGATFPLLSLLLDKLGQPGAANLSFDTVALENYLLICCQKHTGGFIDKPGKNKDLYHTCYALSGLAIARQLSSKFTIPKDRRNDEDFSHIDKFSLVEIDPLYNISSEAVREASAYFQKNHL